jgi:hypothetical protein
METLYVICGFLGPFMLVGIVALFYDLYLRKKESKKDNPTP